MTTQAPPLIRLLWRIKDPTEYAVQVKAARRALAQAKLSQKVNRDIFAFWLKRYFDAVRKGRSKMSNLNSFRGYGKGYSQELSRQFGEGFKVETRPSYITVSW